MTLYIVTEPDGSVIQEFDSFEGALTVDPDPGRRIMSDGKEVAYADHDMDETAQWWTYE